MSNIYTVIFMNADMAILDFKIYGSYTAALKEFLKQAILETKEKFAEEVSGSDDDSEFDVTSDSETDEDDDSDYEDDEDETTCVLQVHAPPEQSDDGEYELKLEYDVESFQEFLSEKDDALEYMNQLEKDLAEPGFTLPTEIVQVFTSSA
jgi:hypothetical protein